MARMLVQSAHFVSPRERTSAFSLAALNTQAVRIVILVSIAVLGATYLWIMNSSTAEGFQLSKLERQRVALESEYAHLQEQEVALRSMDHMTQESEQMKMVAQSTPVYIDRSVQQVAVR